MSALIDIFILLTIFCALAWHNPPARKREVKLTDAAPARPEERGKP